MRLLIFTFLIFTVNSDSLDIIDYRVEREAILQKELTLSIGGNETLTDKEMSVNECLMRYKIQEFDYGFDNPHYFNMSQHYYVFKNDMRTSKVYHIIRDMPKGAALHVHDKAILNADYFVNITYMPDLYVCFGGNRLRLRFSRRIPETYCDGQWQSMSDVRNSSQNIKRFDEELRKHFTIIMDQVNYNVADTWRAFKNYFSAVSPLITYRPIWEQQFYDSLLKFREDNIMYVELRTALPNLYESDGTVYDTMTTAKAFDRVVKRFKTDYPDFIGAKLIYSLSRKMNATTLDLYLKMAKEIKKIIPDTFAGFDLVGQEDLGKPLIEFVPQFITASKEISYFFHAGETNWYGTPTDENILDAILLGSKRIGHAYALAKHPLLMKEIRDRDICIEVNVISNLVLSLVRDTRNHPLSVFIANGLPVVLSSDDPGAWEAEPLSHDFYVAFIGIASKHSDLRLLKQLARNSMKCSALDENNKVEAMKNFNMQWKNFIDTFDLSNKRVPPNIILQTGKRSSFPRDVSSVFTRNRLDPNVHMSMKGNALGKPAATMLLLLILNGFCFIYVVCDVTIPDYNTRRTKLLNDELLMAVGGNITLSEKEIAVNNCLMQLKIRELDYFYNNPQYFNFSHHYFSYKVEMQQSKVYKIIKRMPKGAALHVHDMALLSADYLVGLTYTPDLYMCRTQNDLLFKFSNSTPKSYCKNEWLSVSEMRKSVRNVTEFDAELREQFTIVVNNPDVAYPSIKESWTAFFKYFSTVYPLLSYRPIWEQYFYDALKKFKEDNIMYVEVRSVLPQLYELDGTVYDPIITAKAYHKTVKKFVKDHPEFVGAKLIYAPSRKVNRTTVDTYLELAMKIKDEVPALFAGFDLVGQEDLGNPLIDFVPQLLEASKNFNYFFHAGETDWSGTLTDENLVDAIMLGSKRIGHAYALPKHPLLMRKVVEEHICLEVNVISNAVLSLVRDIRNHPLSIMLANNLPIVLSSDDPGAWDAEPLTDDFYVAFVAAASKHSDLRLLKQLALNSITCSALGNDRFRVVEYFNRQWNRFIDNFNCSAC